MAEASFPIIPVFQSDIPAPQYYKAACVKKKEDWITILGFINASSWRHPATRGTDNRDNPAGMSYFPKS